MTNLITDLSQQKAVTLLRIMYPIWAIVGLLSQNFGRLGDNGRFWLSARFFCSFSFTLLRSNILSIRNYDNRRNNIHGLGFVERG